MSTVFPLLQRNDHKILGKEYCSGYSDVFGQWNTGFYCPQTESKAAVSCCGTVVFKYCCITESDQLEADSMDPEVQSRANSPVLLNSILIANAPLISSIIFGFLLGIVLITIITCTYCSCCLFYRKRTTQFPAGAGLYRLQCNSSSSTGTGNIYSSIPSLRDVSSLNSALAGSPFVDFRLLPQLQRSTQRLSNSSNATLNEEIRNILSPFSPTTSSINSSIFSLSNSSLVPNGCITTPIPYDQRIQLCNNNNSLTTYWQLQPYFSPGTGTETANNCNSRLCNIYESVRFAERQSDTNRTSTSSGFGSCNDEVVARMLTSLPESQNSNHSSDNDNVFRNKNLPVPLRLCANSAGPSGFRANPGTRGRN